MTVEYPVGLPLEDMARLVQMLINANKFDRTVVAKSLWVTVGALLKLVIGDAKRNDAFTASSSELTPGFPVARDITDQEAAALMQAIIDAEIKPEPKEDDAYKSSSLLLTILGSVLIQKQLAAILLPFLIKKLVSWLENGGLESLLKRFVTEAAEGGSSSLDDELNSAIRLT